MADILQEQYQTVFSTPIEGPPVSKMIEGDIQTPTMDTIIVTAETVEEAIKELSAHTAPGPDKFPATVLKKFGKTLAPVMADLWQSSLSTGSIPEIFKKQSIVPIFKKGNRSDPANYRPVSLTSQLIKVFERVVRKQMMQFVEENNLLTSEQHGFRSSTDPAYLS